MNRRDWIGLATSVGLHALLLLIFFTVSLGATEPQNVGFIEVEFGPMAEGQPVRRAVEPRPQPEPQQAQPERQRQPEPPAAPPQRSKPVELPKQAREVADQEKVETPETDRVAPQSPESPATNQQRETSPEPRPTPSDSGGDEEGERGADTGRDGPGQQEQRSSPVEIIGLNRDLLNMVRPGYPVKVNATIQVRITVDPHGRVVGGLVTRKGNPQLEQAAQTALRQWRFNALPANVPQENQTGTVTFRFRVD